MSFLSSLFGGSNSTLNNNIGSLGSLAGFASGQGTGDISSASNFWKSILSGDPSQIGKSLAPEISASQQQGQQQKNAIAQFGNRSGGNNSAAQSIDAQGRGNIINLIGGLQSSAAGNLASTGSGLLNTSLNATSLQNQTSQQQMQNWLNSILGQGISSGIGSLEGFGLGKL